ncbi:hypothetical protein CASFOL_034706 [Castilleja foliolosa]|uniref:Uncharacterized protein n=1 Tax=Castilleja foliolosa TaxID=1961234 RepID=A0ABD3BRR0_9LAMI
MMGVRLWSMKIGTKPIILAKANAQDSKKQGDETTINNGAAEIWRRREAVKRGEGG